MGKREDILTATLELIHIEGLHSVTFAKIFKQAGVGSGTVYNYFNNKEELVNELYRSCRLHMAEMTMIDEDPDQGIYDKFKAIMKNNLEYAMHYPKEYLFIDNFSYSSLISDELRTMDDNGAISFFVSMLVDGQRNGLIKDLDVRILIQIAHGIISSVVKGAMIGRFTLDELKTHQIIESCWKAVRA